MFPERFNMFLPRFRLRILAISSCANYNSVRAVKISFVSTFFDSFFIYITNNDNYNMISLATWYNKHLKIYHQIALENTPTVSLKSKHKVSNIPYPLQRLSTPYPYAT